MILKMKIGMAALLMKVETPGLQDFRQAVITCINDNYPPNHKWLTKYSS